MSDASTTRARAQCPRRHSTPQLRHHLFTGRPTLTMNEYMHKYIQSDGIGRSVAAVGPLRPFLALLSLRSAAAAFRTLTLMADRGPVGFIFHSPHVVCLPRATRRPGLSRRSVGRPCRYRITYSSAAHGVGTLQANKHLRLPLSTRCRATWRVGNRRPPPTLNDCLSPRLLSQ